MRLPLFFALRYMFSPSRLGAVGWITLISAIAIGVVSLSMVLVLSVYNGYVQMIEQATGVSTPELIITPKVGSTLDFNADVRLGLALSNDSVESYAPVLEGLAMLRGASGESLVQIVGVATDYWRVLKKDSLLLDGDIPREIINDDTEDILLGIGVLSSGIDEKDKGGLYTLFFPRRSGMINPLAPSTAFRSREVRLSGMLRPVDQALDRRGYIRLGLMQELLGYESGVASYIAVKGRVGAEQLKERLHTYLGDSYRILNKQEQHPELTLLIRMEKFMVYAIMLFILLLATFNLISGLAMLVMEKRADLSMLAALGMSASSRRHIFSFAGLLIALVGSSLGLILGLALGYVQQTWGIVIAGSGEFAMPFPIVQQASDFLIIFAGTLSISLITSLAMNLFIRHIGYLSED